MDLEKLIGKTIVHKKYGNGTIIGGKHKNEDGKDKITVQFDTVQKDFDYISLFSSGGAQMIPELEDEINADIIADTEQKTEQNKVTKTTSISTTTNEETLDETELSPLYIIMNTFSGRYLTENETRYSVGSIGTIKGNIGHECINFFAPEGIGDNYLLWFNPNGRFSRSYKNKDITLLMVTNFANEKDKFRVLAKAEHCHLVPGANLGGNRAEERYQKFMNSDLKTAKYGNKFLYEILADNTYHKKPDPHNTMATFYTAKTNIYVPTDAQRNVTIRIKKTDNPNESTDINQTFFSLAMRMYIEEQDRINEVKAIIDSIDWVCLNEQNELPGYPKESGAYVTPTSFFSATKNEKDELSLSNIIAFSLANSDVLLQRSVEWLTEGNYTAENAECIISREDKHVDLSIEMQNCTIVIENKIDSTIVVYEDDNAVSFLDRIMKPFKDEKEEKGEDVYRGAMRLAEQLINEVDGDYCQLTKYYIQSRLDAYFAGNPEKPYYYYFLVPNYCANKFVVDEAGMLQGYRYSNKYKMITYKDMFDLFEAVPEYKYREDILKEFKLLSRNLDDSAQNREIYKFLKKAGL